MIPTLQIFDDFHPDPYALRHRVLGSEFKDQIGPDGAKYTNISLHEEKILFACIERSIGFAIVPKLSFWRVDLEGELPHCAVHSDDVLASQASVYYLNTPDQCQGGTAFWKHKELGIDAMPRLESTRVEEVKRIREDWEKLDKWELTSNVGMKFNRFITYPTQMFHSRNPQTGFGKTKHDGRLVWVCFFDVDTRYIVR